MKTGAILASSVQMGAIIGRASAADREALAVYGRALGQAFQIADDLLDAEGEAATVGKATGKDAAKGKSTLVSLLGASTARERLKSLVARAEEELLPFGERAKVLIDTARFVAERQN